MPRAQRPKSDLLCERVGMKHEKFKTQHPRDIRVCEVWRVESAGLVQNMQTAVMSIHLFSVH
jgi:hypothetical protein